MKCKELCERWQGINLWQYSHKYEVKRRFSRPASYTFPPSLCLWTHSHTHTTLPLLSPYLSCLSCLLVPGLASLSVLSRASTLHLCCLSCQLTWPHVPCKHTWIYICVCVCVCVCASSQSDTQARTTKQHWSCILDLTTNLTAKVARRNLSITIISSFMIIFKSQSTALSRYNWSNHPSATERGEWAMEWVKPDI